VSDTAARPDKDVTRTMDDLLARLETKVLAAIAVIQGLRQDNRELESRCASLERELQELQGAQTLLRRQLDEAREVAAQVEFYEQKRLLIEAKVGGLLEKLEGVGS